ncbi:hypothetical protein QR77_16445 [Streptomyces sp. 150FB]|nr:hypothetical protein QR77_16445 [Streptomyces sp. 150FB]
MLPGPAPVQIAVICSSVTVPSASSPRRPASQSGVTWSMGSLRWCGALSQATVSMVVGWSVRAARRSRSLSAVVWASAGAGGPAGLREEARAARCRLASIVARPM